jgi:hypothetical protein
LTVSSETNMESGAERTCCALHGLHHLLITPHSLP